MPHNATQCAPRRYLSAAQYEACLEHFRNNGPADRVFERVYCYHTNATYVNSIVEGCPPSPTGRPQRLFGVLCYHVKNENHMKLFSWRLPCWCGRRHCNGVLHPSTIHIRATHFLCRPVAQRTCLSRNTLGN